MSSVQLMNDFGKLISVGFARTASLSVNDLKGCGFNLSYAR
ncbi:hypothetical protein M2191_004488 [Bradyrhizobium japonicum]|nr:hypothetical protein [Bradyrhizobium japonicum]